MLMSCINYGIKRLSKICKCILATPVILFVIVTAGIAYIDNLAPGPRLRLMRDVDFRNDARNCEQLTKEFIFERLT